MRSLLILFTCASVTSCGTLPDVPVRQLDVGNADYPEFVPINKVALEQSVATAQNLETEETLEARVARLKARAARLRTAQAQ